MRNILSTLLVLLGAALLLAGAVVAYARVYITERAAFAEGSLEALESAGVRRAVEREISDVVLERALSLGRSDARALEPEIREVVDSVIASAAFERVFLTAASALHRVFLEEGRSARFDLSEVAPLLNRELREASPDLQRLVNRQIELELVTVRRTQLAGRTLEAADRLRVLGIALPVLAAVAFLLAIAAAQPHARGLLGAGLAMAVSGALLAIAVPLVRTVAVARLDASGALTTTEVRDAARGIYDAFVGDLLTWALVLAVAGLVLSAVAAVALSRRPAGAARA